MRRISKLSPPSDVSPDGQEPISLREAEDEYLAALPERPNPASFARSSFNQLAKQKLRAQMYREQRSLCIYCEREIAESNTPRIDHWRPLSRNFEVVFCWNNLYLSCPTLETCDSAKGNRPLRSSDKDPDLPWPVNFPYQDVVGFTSRGRIYVRSDVSMPAPTRRALEAALADHPDGIVNLNDPALVTERAAVVQGEIERMKMHSKGKTPTRNEHHKRATALLNQEPCPEFVSIRIAWLRKSLGRGR